MRLWSLLIGERTNFLRQINPIIKKEFDRLLDESIRLSNESEIHSTNQDFVEADKCISESEKLLSQAAEIMQEATKDNRWTTAVKKFFTQSMN